MRVGHLNTTAMVPQMQQLWQADAGAKPVGAAETPPAAAAAAAAAAAETPPAAEAPPIAEEVTSNDVFSEMFAELSKEDDAPVIEKKDEPGKEGAKEAAEGEAAEGSLPTPEQVAADAKAEADRIAAEAEAAKTKKTPTAEPETKPQQISDAAWDRFKQVMEGVDPAKPQPKEEVEPPPYTAEEQELVDAYHKDWPEIAQAEMLLRRTEYRQVVKYVFAQIGQQFGPILGQLVAHAQGATQRDHLNAITTAVPDYNDLRDKVVAWVETQPAVLKAAYSQVIKDGTAEDVTALINHYRTATNTPPPATGTVVPPQAKPGAMPPTRKVVDALKPPGGKRTTPSTNAIAPDDFEGAFEAFSKAS